MIAYRAITGLIVVVVVVVVVGLAGCVLNKSGFGYQTTSELVDREKTNTKS
jgi:hypothetical protein